MKKAGGLHMKRGKLLSHPEILCLCVTIPILNKERLNCIENCTSRFPLQFNTETRLQKTFIMCDLVPIFHKNCKFMGTFCKIGLHLESFPLFQPHFMNFAQKHTKINKN